MMNKQGDTYTCDECVTWRGDSERAAAAHFKWLHRPMWDALNKVSIIQAQKPGDPACTTAQVGHALKGGQADA